MSGLLVDQLPVVMATDTGVAKFLDVVDPMASQLYDVVGAKEVFFDPTVAPLPVVRWLGVRLGVEIDSNLPDDVQRRVFMIAAATHAIRGTAESLRMNLAAITGGVVSIEEHGTIESLPTPQHPPSPQPPSPTDPQAALDRSGVSMVTIQLSTLGPATVTQIRTTIERELRGDVVYRVQQVAPTQHLPAEASA